MLIRAEEFIRFFQRGLILNRLVVYGDDAFFRMQIIDMIRNIFRAKTESGERLVFDCRKGNYDNFISALRSYSLLYSHRLFEIKCLPSQVEELLQYFSVEDGNDFCVVILDDLSWQDKKGAWFVDALRSESTFLFSCIAPISEDFTMWIGSMLKLKGIKYAPDVPEFLSGFFEGNSCGVFQALEQITLQRLKDEITVEFIQSIFFSATRYKVDDCVNAIFSRNRQRFVRVLNYLRESDESLMSLLVWRFAHDLRVCCAYYGESPATSNQVDLFFQKRKVFGARRSFFIEAVKFLKESDIVKALSRLSFIDKKHKAIVPGNPWEDFFWLGIFLMR
ncbi:MULTISPECIES: DNA polymerase III subunit delta [Candidatus Ichthyocystis]|uniref:DNA polymerase III subunit delta n=1 Tax=Candidatus Ichthyocystis TaxID=2929841 RepID=UPI000B827420|nr:MULTISPECIES: DNA polymerase III subunit delta [Ichthyocystis]